jgi:hypothetical protein
VRKFLSNFPENKADTFGVLFLGQMMDTLNNLKYITPEAAYHESAVEYAPSFPDMFYKRELKEDKILKSLEDILAERKIFFYEGIIIDKRLSAVNPNERTHIKLENTILVVPHKNAFKYVIPRYNGVKYVLDEVPFYYEGTTCALLPCYNCEGNTVNNRMVLANTPGSTYNDNTRSEVSVFKINTDSLSATASIRESLRGQFSTILRHFYSKESVDSTIEESYFKKCTEKPRASGVRIEPGTVSEKFPVSNQYHCTENIKIANKEIIDLHNWFSFTFKKEDYQELPTHDFYFDFQYTDVYHFMFELDKPAELINMEELTKNLNNDYFEVSSNLVKKDERNYLLNVSVKVKRNVIQKKDGQKLLDFVSLLNEINNFKIHLKY